jgi:hypothetical protein
MMRKGREGRRKNPASGVGFQAGLRSFLIERRQNNGSHRHTSRERLSYQEMHGGKSNLNDRRSA